MRCESADDESWLNEWKKHFKPLRVGRVVIVPEWESYTPRKSSTLSFGEACCDFGAAQDEVVFTIDPGSAFGTGQHQTTQLCVSAMQKYISAGDTILDIGCGSGILSIIALLLNAEKVVACDIDPAGAIAATRKNARLNPVDLTRLEVHAGDALSDENLREKICAHKYDVVVANIVADVIVELVPLAKAVLKTGGYFVSSGIIAERASEVVDGFEKSGFKIEQNLSLDGWHCIVGRAL
jgi:ribosomal protein L11 methyltransferase